MIHLPTFYKRRWSAVFSFFFILYVHCKKSSFCASAFDPLALHQLHEIDLEDEIVISLQGFDLDGDKTIATITALPTYGTIHQLTHVFNKYGYDPKAGIQITSVPTVVTGTNSRIVYKKPCVENHKKMKGQFDRFEYTVSDESTLSEPGTVTIVKSSHLLVGSEFLFSTEDWNTIGNRNHGVQHEASSKGEMNHYVYSTDNSINVNLSGDDIDVWRFNAPEKFLGWHAIFYGGTFEFTLSSFSGDFSKENLNFNGEMNLLEISCSSCLRGKGITIAYPLLNIDGFSGSTTKFSINMTETSGWLKDPQNTLLPWTIPSKCDFIRVFSDISSMTILGDFSKWYESVSIDSVYWRSPKPMGRLQLPSCAQQTPDARVCSCVA